jgi:pimeloyl-ACP methyl ester carboxylesterase
VHLIHGAEDSICPAAAADFMAVHFPLASLKIIPAAGHAPFLSAAEMFNTEVTGFVRTVHGRD